MARSEAQKAADKRYREAHKGELVKWGTWLKPEESAQADTIIKQSGMSRADFIRWAVSELEKVNERNKTI